MNRTVHGRALCLYGQVHAAQAHLYCTHTRPDGCWGPCQVSAPILHCLPVSKSAAPATAYTSPLAGELNCNRPEKGRQRAPRITRTTRARCRARVRHAMADQMEPSTVPHGSHLLGSGRAGSCSAAVAGGRWLRGAGAAEVTGHATWTNRGCCSVTSQNHRRQCQDATRWHAGPLGVRPVVPPSALLFSCSFSCLTELCGGFGSQALACFLLGPESHL
ncbi:hypothetical protein BD289DRAFT_135289 [Coniella lustricola]|uniref:Uncharacterized protein n=1 Tax=Coniella lustricola TaxID=2025994 RepID=A0A2T3AFC1_9PEZI|nr:hypothetical protein BD289DRAFT_135289 [Coniella lustricola]